MQMRLRHQPQVRTAQPLSIGRYNTPASLFKTFFPVLYRPAETSQASGGAAVPSLVECCLMAIAKHLKCFYK